MSRKEVTETHRSLRRLGVVFRPDDPEIQGGAKGDDAATARIARAPSESASVSQQSGPESPMTDEEKQSESLPPRKSVDPPNPHREWNYESGLRAGPTALALSVVSLGLWVCVIVAMRMISASVKINNWRVLEAKSLEGAITAQNVAITFGWLSAACFFTAIVCALIAIVRRASVKSGLIALAVCSVQIAMTAGMIIWHW